MLQILPGSAITGCDAASQQAFVTAMQQQMGVPLQSTSVGTCTVSGGAGRRRLQQVRTSWLKWLWGPVYTNHSPAGWGFLCLSGSLIPISLKLISAAGASRASPRHDEVTRAKPHKQAFIRCKTGRLVLLKSSPMQWGVWVGVWGWGMGVGEETLRNIQCVESPVSCR